MFQDVFLVLLVLLMSYVIWSLMVKPKGMPPCPHPIPILGSLLPVVRCIKQKNLHLELAKLAKFYHGKLFTLKLPGESIVVVNSASTAREALVTKRDEFSGRPFMFTFDYVTRGSKNILTQDFNSTLLFQRKIVHSTFRLYQPKLEAKVTKEVNLLIKRLIDYLEKPINPHSELILTVINVICAMVYGDRYDLDDPEFQMLFNYDQKMIMIPLLGALNILNIFPYLIHFPITDMKDIKYVMETRNKIFNKKYHEHQRSYQDGAIRDLTDALIKALKETDREDIKTSSLITEDHVVMTMADVFSSFKTTSTQILWFLFFMARHPDIQAKVQEELDTVIGRDGLVGWEDRTSLNYTFATIEEVLRLSSVSPILSPHKTTQDSTLEGYIIPKGTTIFVNVMAMHLDEKEWKDPLVVDPERFLDEEGKLIQGAGLKSYLPFGAGRRVCIGEVLAKQMLFIISTSLLQKFNMEGEPSCLHLSLHGEMPGIIHHPKPFNVCFKQR